MDEASGTKRAGGALLRAALIAIGALASIVGILAVLELISTSRTGASTVVMLAYAVPALVLAFLCFRAVRRSIVAAAPTQAAHATASVAIGLLQFALLAVGGAALAIAIAAVFDGTPTTSAPDLVRLGRILVGAVGVFGVACLYAVYALQRRKRGRATDWARGARLSAA